MGKLVNVGKHDVLNVESDDVPHSLIDAGEQGFMTGIMNYTCAAVKWRRCCGGVTGDVVPPNQHFVNENLFNSPIFTRTHG